MVPPTFREPARRAIRSSWTTTCPADQPPPPSRNARPRAQPTSPSDVNGCDWPICNIHSATAAPIGCWLSAGNVGTSISRHPEKGDDPRGGVTVDSPTSSMRYEGFRTLGVRSVDTLDHLRLRFQARMRDVRRRSLDPQNMGEPGDDQHLERPRRHVFEDELLTIA
jgi:hypothetical protein